MNDELPDGPEYVFAQAVIDRLAGKKRTGQLCDSGPV